MKSANDPLIHIHTDRAEVRVARGGDQDRGVVVPEVPCVTVVLDYTGEVIERGRKVCLSGTWTLRQYRNPVPCGATTVLLPGPDAQYEMEVTE